MQRCVGEPQTLSPKSFAFYSGWVTGDCHLNLSGSAIKLTSLIISSAVRKGYKAETSLPFESS